MSKDPENGDQVAFPPYWSELIKNLNNTNVKEITITKHSEQGPTECLIDNAFSKVWKEDLKKPGNYDWFCVKKNESVVKNLKKNLNRFIMISKCLNSKK